MSFPGSRNCKCPRFVFSLEGRAKREWVVIQRNQNRSAYNGHEWDVDKLLRRAVKSKWSHILCLTCGHHWRSWARYVAQLPDLGDEGALLCYRGLREGKPAGQLLLVKIRDSYNRPLFRSEFSASDRLRAKNPPAKAAIGGRSRR